MKQSPLDSKKSFIITSLIFVLSDIIFMLLDNKEPFNWRSILISYVVFCVIYYVINKIIQAIKE
jgi:hypothetical protein